MNKIFIIVPAFNEASKISSVIDELLKNFYYNIVVVDDGSTDNTEEKLTDYSIYYIKHLLNCGQGSALRVGTEFAIKKGADFIVHFDADGQMSVQDIKKFIIELERDPNLEIVLGSRFLNIESQKYLSKSKKYILKLAKIFHKLVFNIDYSDPQNGFRVFRPSVYKKIYWFNNKMAHCSEILYNIKKNKVKYKEIPVIIKYTDYSIKKGVKFKDAFKIVWDLFMNKF